MGERVNTGGEKEFHYSKKNIKEIESGDTHSTREFIDCGFILGFISSFWL